MKDKIIVIVGPTAVGKTSFSIEVAQKFNGEIISGDSMQVYKNLDIGTAKVTPDEMENISHYLIDVKEVDEDYTVSNFQKDATLAIQVIIQKGKTPIIVGGTGLYIESVLFDVSHGSSDAQPNKEFREIQAQFAKEHGNSALWGKLDKIDPEAAAKIHENNVQRVIRALEVYHETGQTFTSFQAEREEKQPLYDAHIIGLNTERALLYERINLRVDLMMKAGLLEEAETLWTQMGPDKNYSSTKGIGYSELFDYFNQEEGLTEAVELIKRNSRRYAKRQLTWFRNRLDHVNWYDFVLEPETKDASLTQIQQFIEGD